MGLGAAGFARVPGSGDQGPGASRLDGKPSTAQVLMNEGVSFTWEANDGSQIFAHWLQDHYDQGDNIDKNTVATNCSQYRTTANADVILDHIKSYITANGPTAVSPYMFVAIGDDFVAPKPCLLTYIDIWNKQAYGVSQDDGDVYVVSATFDHYTELVQAFTSNAANKRPLQVRKFEPTPYWTGFYASRPALKSMQQTALRLVSAGETLAVLTRTAKQFESNFRHIWQYLAPTTHHDFITGTAPDPVEQGEQLPYGAEANIASYFTLQTLLSQLAASLTSDATPTESPFMVFNSLGFNRKVTPLELPVPRSSSHHSFFDGQTHHAIQATEDGKTITTIGHIASQSYLVGKLTADHPSTATEVRIRTGDNAAIIENPFIRVVITQDALWGATSIIDVATGTELIDPTEVDAGAFTLQMLSDAGNIYRFGNEMEGCDFGKTVYKPSSSVAAMVILESGPVRARVQTSVDFTSPTSGEVTTIKRTYTLYHHDEMIRVDVEGSTPTATSVFLRTPLAMTNFKASYGTPYHYDTHMPDAYWAGYNFFVVHNFLTLTSNQGANLGFYSSELHAWALDGNTVVTALLRNTPGGVCTGYGAEGSDSGNHRVSLALRIPHGLSAAPSLTPLTESLSLTTILYTSSELGRTSSPNSPRTSLLNITGDAIIVSTKPAEADPSKIVVRLYCPTATASNAVKFKLSTLGPIKAISAISALERSEVAPNTISVLSSRGNEASIQMNTALATVLITPGW